MDPKRPKLKQSLEKKSRSSNEDSDSKPQKPLASGRQLTTSKRPPKSRPYCSDESDSGPSSSSSNKDHPSFDSCSTQSSDSYSSSEPISSSSSPSSVDFEARDRWIAQLYRFMDEGGAPINKAPSLANKDLDLYRLYRLVRELGGFHRVTAQLKWGYIYSKLRLPHNFAAGPRNLQAAFKRYLYPLDDISRKLGTDLDNLPLARPRHITPSASLMASGSRSSAAACRSANFAGSTTSIKVPPSESKPNDKSSGMKPILTATDGLPVGETSMERTSERTIESSPPVLSPPVLGCTPSPSDDWASTSLDLTPLKGARKHQLSQSEKEPKRDPEDRGESVVVHASPVANEENFASATEKLSVDLLQGDASVSCPIVSDRSSSSNSSVASSRCERKGNRSLRAKRLPLFLNLPDDFGTLSDQTSTAKLNQVIPIGSRVRVRCGDRVAYEAKVLKHIRPQSGLIAGRRAGSVFSNTWSEPTELQYRVHYLGWNTRHDEVVSRSRIISVVEWAHSSYEDRPPSCSSLNFAVQAPRKAGHTGRRKALSTSPCSEAPYHETSVPVVQLKNGNNATNSDNRRPTKVEETEEDGGSDLSHTAETASDIVTTLAPMVRCRRPVLTPDEPRKRFKVNSEATSTNTKRPLATTPSDDTSSSVRSHMSDQEDVIVKREADSSESIKRRQHESASLVRKRLISSTGKKFGGFRNQSFKRPALKRPLQNPSVISRTVSSNKTKTDPNHSASMRTSKSTNEKRQTHRGSKQFTTTKCAPPTSHQSRKKQGKEPDDLNSEANVDEEFASGSEGNVKSKSIRPNSHQKDSSPKETNGVNKTVIEKSRDYHSTKTEEEPTSGTLPSGPTCRDPKASVSALGQGEDGRPKDELLDVLDNRNFQQSSRPRRSRSTTSKSTSDTKDKSSTRRSVPSKKSKGSAVSDAESDSSSSAPSSSHSEENDSSESGFGAIDALPRLTRSQHRQLLGDTPPGAALQTASPVSTGSVPSAPVKSESSLVVKDSVDMEVKLELKPETKTTPQPETSQPLSTIMRETPFCEKPSSNVELARSTSLHSDSVASQQPLDQSDQAVADSTSAMKAEDVEHADNDPEPAPSRRLSKLRPRNNNHFVGSAFVPIQPIEPGEVSPMSKVDTPTQDDDARSSVHTMSTDPMRDVMFDFTMSPSERSLTSSSADSVAASPDRDLGDEASSQQQNEPGSMSETDELALFQSLGDFPNVAGRNKTGEENQNEELARCASEERSNDDAQRFSKTKRRPDRVRRVSANESADCAARKLSRRAAVERSPTPSLDSPHYPRSPAVPMTLVTNADGCATTSLPSKSAQTTVAPLTRLAPSQRRFGGPFFPIPGFDEMNSETRCLILQDRMYRILEAWRSAKQCLKDLDQRTNRNRRLRTRQSTVDAQPSTPSARQTAEADVITSVAVESTEHVETF